MSTRKNPASVIDLFDPRPLSPQFILLPMDVVHHGEGCIAGLGKELERLGVEKALCVTGTTLGTRTNLVERLEECADGRIAGVYTESVQHVHRQTVLKAVEMARSLGVDGIVSFGGGSPIDTGKAIAMTLAQGIETADDFEAMRAKFTYPSTLEIPPITGTAVPIVAVPTTLSASEFTNFCGITDEKRLVKDLYIDSKMTARAVFMDPDLTMATPQWLWLSTGIRAVDHSVEALSSNTAHPMTDALAFRSLGMMNNELWACKADGEDKAARLRASVGAWLSITGLANVTLGLSHGIGHQLGARNDVPHGYTSAVMMYPTMVFNKDHVGTRQAVIASAMGVDVGGMDPEEASEAGREAILGLVEDLGLPHRLRDVGVEPADFPAIAKDALEDMIVATNPCPVSGTDDVIALLESAY